MFVCIHSEAGPLKTGQSSRKPFLYVLEYNLVLIMLTDPAVVHHIAKIVKNNKERRTNHIEE